jgi:hypothetical protein
LTGSQTGRILELTRGAQRKRSRPVGLAVRKEASRSPVELLSPSLAKQTTTL